MQTDLSVIIHQTFSHPTLHPSNLTIVSGKKYWLVHLDIIILSDCGNIHDALFIAASAALRDTKIPRTRQIEYKAQNSHKMKEDVEDVQMTDVGQSGFDTRAVKSSTDFELVDYWDDGEPLKNASGWPVCITLNLVNLFIYLFILKKDVDK